MLPPRWARLVSFEVPDRCGSRCQTSAMRASNRSRRFLFVAAISASVVVGVAGCGSDDSSATPSAETTTVPAAPATPPSLVGTWVGDYTYPLADSSGAPTPIDATETLIIQQQDGALVWGVDQYVENGNTIEIPVRGAIDASGEGVTITEDGGFFRGEIRSDGSLFLRFTRTDDQFTAFEVTLHRQ